MKIYGVVLSRHPSTSFELQKLDLFLSFWSVSGWRNRTASFLCREEVKNPNPQININFFYLLYLAPFDSGYQKGHKFSFFVFCPRTIMEFLSVFLSSEDIISGLNKWKKYKWSQQGPECMAVFLTLICCAYVSKIYSVQLPPLQSEIPLQMLSKYLWQHPKREPQDAPLGREPYCNGWTQISFCSEHPVFSA